MPSFSTPEPIHLVVDLPYGELDISTADTDVTDVRLDPSTDGHHIVVEQRPGVVAVVAPKGVRSWFSVKGHADARVVVPAGSHLTVDLSAGDINARGSYADCKVRTGGGDIRIDRAGAVQAHNSGGDVRIDHAAGDIDVTAAGDIRIEQVDGHARIKNGAGDTRIGHAGGDLKLSTSAGDAVIERVTGDLSAKAACGDLRVGRVEGPHVELIGAHGDIEVGVPNGMSVWLDADSAYGDLVNDLAAVDGPYDDVGTLELVAKSSYGDIRIRRA